MYTKIQCKKYPATVARCRIRHATPGNFNIPDMCFNNVGKPDFIFIYVLYDAAIPNRVLCKSYVGLSLHVLGQMDPLYTYLYVP